MHNPASTFRRACVVAVAAALLGGLIWVPLARGAVTPSLMDGLAVQSVDVGAWPRVTMRVVLPSSLLAATLRSSDFAVRENGSVVTSVTARALEKVRHPLDVILLVDASGSMRGRPLADAKAAAAAFVGALGTDDRVAVVRFSSRPSVAATFTADKAQLSRAISGLSTGGTTSLYDALVMAARSFVPVRDTDRAIVLLSDGADSASGNTLESASAALSSAAAPVYAVTLDSAKTDYAPLSSLARASGGRVAPVGDTVGLVSAFGDIAKQITRPYEVTYTSLRPPAKDLEIDVVVTGRDGRATLSAVVANPDMSAGRVVTSAVAQLPGSAWPVGIALSVFLAVAAASAAIALIMRPEGNSIDQLKYYEQLRAPGPVAATAEEYVDPRSVRARLLTLAGTVTARGGFDAVIRRELERAGLPLRPAEYMTLHASAVLIAGMAVQLLSSSLMVTLIAVVALALGPILVLTSMAQRRADAFQSQLPDVLNLLSGSMRAGWGLLQAAGMVANEIASPAGPEFERVVTEARLGLPLEEAFGKMADRMGSEDFKWAVTAISIQREVGGNLAEVLDLVAETVRERADLRRQVKSLTAEGRLSAVILIALPFLEAVALAVLNPGYFSGVFSTSLGIGAAIGGALLMVFGIVWLLQVIRIEV